MRVVAHQPARALESRRFPRKMNGINEKRISNPIHNEEGMKIFKVIKFPR